MRVFTLAEQNNAGCRLWALWIIRKRRLSAFSPLHFVPRFTASHFNLYHPVVVAAAEALTVVGADTTQPWSRRTAGTLKTILALVPNHDWWGDGKMRVFFTTLSQFVRLCAQVKAHRQKREQKNFTRTKKVPILFQNKHNVVGFS